MSKTVRVFGVYALLVALALGFITTRAHGSDELLNRLGDRKPSSLVSDFADVIDSGREAALESLLVDLDRKTGVQIAVVTLKSLDGGQIDDFANRLYEKWRIGSGNTDEGALLLAAMEDRKVRIEVGYGLEGILPDAKAGRILDRDVLPRFRGGQFGDGMIAGAMTLATVVAEDRGVELSSSPRYGSSGRDSGRQRSPLLSLIFFLILIPIMIRHPFLALLLLSGGRGGGFSGGGFGGGGFGGFGGGLSGGGGASRGW